MKQEHSYKEQKCALAMNKTLYHDTNMVCTVYNTEILIKSSPIKLIELFHFVIK